MSNVRVLVGTRKGTFIMTSDANIMTSDAKRNRWDISGPHFAGWEIYHLKAAFTQLLVEAVNLGISREYIQRILAVIHAPKTPGTGREDGTNQTGATVHSTQTPCLESGEHISERELEVLRLMARGASNHEIAEQLVITVGTVKSHINHIFVKLDAHNRTEAVARARGLGLIDF